MPGSEDEELLALLERYRSDLPYFVERCLKIRTKSGAIVELVLNDAQRYIHAKLEQQLAKTGRVRAIVLKGRQQGACFAPDMRVLTSDFRWVAIGEVQPGQRVLAVDEGYGAGNTSRRVSRKFRTAMVEAVARHRKEAFRVEFDNGAHLVVTGEHRLLFKQRGGCLARWQQVSWAKVGDAVRLASHRPLRTQPSYEDGWFGGMLDGEGSMRGSGSVRLSVHQVPGPVLERARSYLESLGVVYGEVIDDRQAGASSKFGNKPVHRLDIHRSADVMQVLGLARPSRFVVDGLFDGQELPGKGSRSPGAPAVVWSRITSITSVGEIEVVDLQTSEKTYVCEGFVSHNSTYIGARFYWKSCLHFGKRTAVMTHDQDTTDALFEMVERYHENMPRVLRQATSADNAKELTFAELDSGYTVATAGNKAAKRGHTIQYFHGSEVASWPNADDHMSGIGQTVPDEDGTEIVLESTAKGLGNLFHRKCMAAMAGQGEYILIFVPWFMERKYRRPVPEGFRLTAKEAEYKALYGLDDEQMAWRRNKIESDFTGDETRFCEEYPANPQEAFQAEKRDTFIPVADVVAARKHVFGEQPTGPLVIGVDPARFGDDRTAIAWRRGRELFRMVAKQKLDTMQVAGLVAKIIKTDRPRRVFIDVIGIGAGVYDRLVELGHGRVVVAVNVAERAVEPDKYDSKRSELWGRLKDWLRAGPVSIPDHDAIAQDLLQPGYGYTSSGQTWIESKKDIKKRGAPSPDLADAACLTFAEELADEEERPESDHGSNIVGDHVAGY